MELIHNRDPSGLKEELMSKPKLKLLATPDKTPPEKPLVELSKDQLEAIAGGTGRIGIASTTDSHRSNHNETIVSRAQLNCRSSPSIQPGGLTP